MTIRRDLQKLEEQGAVQSVSGGVQAPERVASEPSHQAKEGMFSRQKIAIGRLAARQIPPTAVFIWMLVPPRWRWRNRSVNVKI